MRFLLLIFLTCSILRAKLQIKDYLDDCDWCKNQLKSTQPLDIGEWSMRCKKKPKPIWFNYGNIGRVYGTYKEKTSMCWIYSEKLGWIYNTPQYKNYIYTHKLGWIYVRDGKVYIFKNKKWDYFTNINS